ncbi:hypothetical protein BK809_0003853 [Diplodia seriata]|uniref:Uncharacterized protein n=1 Tax=Diplodia seriata TaxID=420778 RepID=A0A1S8BGV3_9PEZI|nr:hypothetical protein BK809_0003853 [Diplodia seriata]
MRMNTDNQNWTMKHTGSEMEMSPDKILLQSLEDFITYAFDSSIIAMASSLAVLTNETISVNATVSVRAIIFGSAGYVYGIFAINAVICIVYGAEALRTRGWRLISPVDFLDIATLVVAASRGGSGIAESFEEAVMGDSEGKGRRAVGTLKVQVDGGATVDYSSALVTGASFVERHVGSQESLLLRTRDSDPR